MVKARGERSRSYQPSGTGGKLAGMEEVTRDE